MKLFDKIKDLFSDYEEVEEEVFLEEEKKEEYKLPKVMRDVIEKEEVILPKKKEVEEVKVEEKKFSIPIDFEKEFEMTPSRRNNTNNQNVIKEIKSVQNTSYSRQEPVKNVYMEPKPIKIEKEQKPKFKASPVISPVYGILDKNYTKEEVKEKKEDKRDIKRSSKKVDFETVRKKAFGNLTDEIKDNLLCENCELLKEARRNATLKEDDLLIITADHGNDPTYSGSDHTREYVPFVVYGKNVKPENLGTVEGFDFISRTVKDILTKE